MKGLRLISFTFLLPLLCFTLTSNAEAEAKTGNTIKKVKSTVSSKYSYADPGIIAAGRFSIDPKMLVKGKPDIDPGMLAGSSVDKDKK